MYEVKAQHVLSGAIGPLPDEVKESMWRLFVSIGVHWQSAADPLPMRSRLFSFMSNRIALIPLYADYYPAAKACIDDLAAKLGSEDAAFVDILSNESAPGAPATTPMQLMQQHVVDEFITLFVALGGFKTFGAANWPGYFGGANVPGRPPYRTGE